MFLLSLTVISKGRETEIEQYSEMFFVLKSSIKATSIAITTDHACPPFIFVEEIQ